MFFYLIIHFIILIICSTTLSLSLAHANKNPVFPSLSFYPITFGRFSISILTILCLFSTQAYINPVHSDIIFYYPLLFTYVYLYTFVGSI